jgi:2,5-diketo-D-gluconate reductase A
MVGATGARLQKLTSSSHLDACPFSIDVSSPRQQIPRIALNDGHSIPQVGLGTWKIDEALTPQIVETAIGCGYRLIDTAANYRNESGIGLALAKSSLPREHFVVTTKLWNDSHGYDQTLRAFDASASRLRLEVIDLYLIHWPLPQLGQYVDTWRAFIELRKQGRVRSIGVSNFTARQLERIIGETGVVPALNQVEMHPALQQRSLRETHQRYGIVTEAWSPLGQGRSLNNQALQTIAQRHSRTAAQVILRWHIEGGVVVVPRSTTSTHLEENMDVFTFALTRKDHAEISALDRATGRIGYDPGTQGW